MINYDYNSIGRGEISVHKDSSKSDLVISRLVIRGAKLHDSGNYTCTPSNAEPTSIYVHVLQGEKRLSSRIQNDESSSIEQSGSNSSFHASLYTYTWTYILWLIMVIVEYSSNLGIVT